MKIMIEFLFIDKIIDNFVNNRYTYITSYIRVQIHLTQLFSNPLPHKNIKQLFLSLTEIPLLISVFTLYLQTPKKTLFVATHKKRVSFFLYLCDNQKIRVKAYNDRYYIIIVQFFFYPFLFSSLAGLAEFYLSVCIVCVVLCLFIYLPFEERIKPTNRKVKG